MGTHLELNYIYLDAPINFCFYIFRNLYYAYIINKFNILKFLQLATVVLSFITSMQKFAFTCTGISGKIYPLLSLLVDKLPRPANSQFFFVFNRNANIILNTKLIKHFRLFHLYKHSVNKQLNNSRNMLKLLVSTIGYLDHCAVLPPLHPCGIKLIIKENKVLTKFDNERKIIKYISTLLSFVWYVVLLG